jgi:hypothetical protein
MSFDISGALADRLPSPPSPASSSRWPIPTVTQRIAGLGDTPLSLSTAGFALPFADETDK